VYSIGPDGFEDDFIDYKFVAYRKFGLTTRHPVYFGECDAKIFPFGKDLLMTVEASVQV
jgi:hypothetical protein